MTTRANQAKNRQFPASSAQGDVPHAVREDSNLASQESRSYQDPLGRRALLAQTAAQNFEAQFPPVKDVYAGFYTHFAAEDRTGNAYLAGAEGIIGGELSFREADGKILLVNHAGLDIGSLSIDASEQLSYYIINKWQVKLLLSLVLYDPKLRIHTAEIACMCYAPEVAESFDSFARNIAYRVAKGEHPGLTLGQDQLIRVLQSKGAWYLTKAEKLPAQEPGVIVYKRRRSLGEGLVSQAYQGRWGCKFAAVIFWVLLALFVAASVWWFFWRPGD